MTGVLRSPQNLWFTGRRLVFGMSQSLRVDFHFWPANVSYELDSGGQFLVVSGQTDILVAEDNRGLWARRARETTVQGRCGSPSTTITFSTCNEGA